jgi:uncharacterized protein YdhG (YjbR/CyaY superfamily)
MAKAGSKPTEAEQVNDWIDKFDAAFKPSINAVRKIIKTAATKLTERIKWNAPSYYYKEDIVTFGPTKAKDKIILVFHHPNIVKIRSELLQGNYKDRRLVYLNSMKEIKDAQKELERIIKESVAMIDK